MVDVKKAGLEDDYHTMMESLTGSIFGSPYVDIDLEEKSIVLDGTFSIDDLIKIIKFKKRLLLKCMMLKAGKMAIKQIKKEINSKTVLEVFDEK